MSHVAEHVRAPRRRADLIRDDRLPRADMRTRSGKRFATILAAIRNEFGDVDPIKAAEIARLRMISETAQRDCLAGKTTPDKVVQISNLIARKELGLAAARHAKSASGSTLLSNYLAKLAKTEAVESDQP
jgi:hypothetical protein